MPAAELSGDIGMYWEYTGTGWITNLNRAAVITDAARQYDKEWRIPGWALSFMSSSCYVHPFEERHGPYHSECHISECHGQSKAETHLDAARGEIGECLAR